MADRPYIALALVALLTAAGNLLWPTRAKRIRRALAAQPRARLMEARGTVRVTGRVRATGKLLRAPLSGRRCVAYEVIVDEAGSDSNSGRLVEQRRACPFLVADESGDALVDTSGPFLLAVAHDRTGGTRWFARYPGKHFPLSLLLESEGMMAIGKYGFWKPFQYAEGVLEEGELVSVGGAIAREIDPMGERPDPRSPPERLVLRGTEAVPLLIGDTRSER